MVELHGVPEDPGRPVPPRPGPALALRVRQVDVPLQVQHRDPLRLRLEVSNILSIMRASPDLRAQHDAVVVAVAGDLLVHHEAPLEGDSVDRLGALGPHHVAPHAVQVHVLRVDTLPKIMFGLKQILK